MAVKFLIGNKEIFLEFLDSINKNDKVAILTHNDLDGIASAIFMEEILKNKKINIKLIKFLNYKKGMLFNVISKLNSEKISKVFLLDLGIDVNDLDNFEMFRKKFDVFLIDHHPFNKDIKNTKNIIKTESGDCAAYIVYELGENLFKRKKWDWLVCAAIIADMAYRKKETLEFVKKIYPNVNEENIGNSEIGELSKTISSALICYKDNLKKVYDLIKKEDLKSLKNCRVIIDNELDKQIKNLKKEAEFYSKEKICFYMFKSKFNITSIISTLVSIEKPDFTFIIIQNKGDGTLGVSARNQNKTLDMNLLMQNAIKGLKNAVGGGHVAAAGATFMKKDLEKFKENILEDLKQ